MRFLRLFKYTNIRRYLYVLLFGLTLFCINWISDYFFNKIFITLNVIGAISITIFIAMTITIIIANFAKENNLFCFDRYVLKHTIISGANIYPYINRNKNIEDEYETTHLFKKYFYHEISTMNMSPDTIMLTRINTDSDYKGYLVIINDNIFKLMKNNNIEFNIEGVGNSITVVMMSKKHFKHDDIVNYDYNSSILFRLKNNPELISKFKMLIN